MIIRGMNLFVKSLAFMFIIFPNQGKHFVRHHDVYFTVLFSSDLYLIRTDALVRAGKHFVKF